MLCNGNMITELIYVTAVFYKCIILRLGQCISHFLPTTADIYLPVKWHCMDPHWVLHEPTEDDYFLWTWIPFGKIVTQTS